MLYRVFDTEADVDAANARWRAASDLDGDDTTQRWDTGRTMIDGRIACIVPTAFADAFGGLELELAETDFPEVDNGE
jgi:hypothetical protein